MAGSDFSTGIVTGGLDADFWGGTGAADWQPARPNANDNAIASRLDLLALIFLVKNTSINFT